VTGGDLLANSIFTFLLMFWLAIAIIRPIPNNNWVKVALPILLGITLSSRANFIFLIPLIFFFEVFNAGIKKATISLLLIALGFGLVTFPFYIYDPAGFSPLHTANKLKQFQSILPKAEFIIPILMGILALILSLHKRNRSLNVLLRNSAIVLAFPVICGLILQSIKCNCLDFDFASFGLSFLFFGAVASWSKLLPEHNSSTQHYN